MRYHFNPETGKTGKCSAKTEDSCEFRGVSDHYDNPMDARMGYEDHMRKKLDEVLRSGRRDAMEEQPEFSEVVLSDIDHGNYVDPSSGVNFVRDADFRSSREVWDLKVAGSNNSNASFSLAFNDDEIATGTIYDEDGETLDYFTMYKSIHEDDNSLEHRARVLDKASKMVAHHRPEYAKGNENMRKKIDDYRDGKVELAGVPMIQTSFVSPEMWEADYLELPKNVGSLNVRVRHGVATASIQDHNGEYTKIFSESFETHGGGDGAFFDPRFAGKFLDQVEKKLRSDDFGL